MEWSLASKTTHEQYPVWFIQKQTDTHPTSFQKEHLTFKKLKTELRHLQNEFGAISSIPTIKHP